MHFERKMRRRNRHNRVSDRLFHLKIDDDDVDGDKPNAARLLLPMFSQTFLYFDTGRCLQFHYLFVFQFQLLLSARTHAHSRNQSFSLSFVRTFVLVTFKFCPKKSIYISLVCLSSGSSVTSHGIKNKGKGKIRNPIVSFFPFVRSDCLFIHLICNSPKTNI